MRIFNNSAGIPSKRNAKNPIVILAATIILVGTSLATPASASAAGGGCGGTAWAAPGTVWGPESKATDSLAGHLSNPPYRAYYSWEVQGNVPAPVVVQAKG